MRWRRNSASSFSSGSAAMRLDRIAVGTDRLVQRQSSGVLTLSMSPDFAAKWLVHRLGRFAEVAPAFPEFPAPDLAARRAHRARPSSNGRPAHRRTRHRADEAVGPMLSKAAQAGGVP